MPKAMIYTTFDQLEGELKDFVLDDKTMENFLKKMEAVDLQSQQNEYEAHLTASTIILNQ